MGAAVPLRARTADWVVLAEVLYERSIVGVSGTRPWSELPADTRLGWFARAEQYENGRLYYEYLMSGVPDAPAWDQIGETRRDIWITTAMGRKL